MRGAWLELARGPRRRTTGHRTGAARKLVHLGGSVTCFGFDLGASAFVFCTHVLYALLHAIKADHSCVPGENWALFGQHFSLCKGTVGSAQRATVSQAGNERGTWQEQTDPRSRAGGQLAGFLGKWACGGCRQKEEEHEWRKAPHPTLGPKQLTWGAGGFLADPLQVPTPSRKLPAVSWPWDSRQLTPCLMMMGSTSFTGTLRKSRARLVSCPPPGLPTLAQRAAPGSWGTEVSGGRSTGQMVRGT